MYCIMLQMGNVRSNFGGGLWYSGVETKDSSNHLVSGCTRKTDRDLESGTSDESDGLGMVSVILFEKQRCPNRFLLSKRLSLQHSVRDSLCCSTTTC